MQHFMVGAMEEESMQDCVFVIIADSQAILKQWVLSAGDIHFIKEDVKLEIKMSNPSVFDTGGNWELRIYKDKSLPSKAMKEQLCDLTRCFGLNIYKR